MLFKYQNEHVRANKSSVRKQEIPCTLSAAGITFSKNNQRDKHGNGSGVYILPMALYPLLANSCLQGIHRNWE